MFNQKETIERKTKEAVTLLSVEVSQLLDRVPKRYSGRLYNVPEGYYSEAAAALLIEDKIERIQAKPRFWYAENWDVLAIAPKQRRLLIASSFLTLSLSRTLK